MTIYTEKLIDVVVTDQYGRVVGRSREGETKDWGVDMWGRKVTFIPRSSFSLSDDEWFYGLPLWQ